MPYHTLDFVYKCKHLYLDLASSSRLWSKMSRPRQGSPGLGSSHLYNPSKCCPLGLWDYDGRDISQLQYYFNAHMGKHRADYRDNPSSSTCRGVCPTDFNTLVVVYLKSSTNSSTLSLTFSSCTALFSSSISAFSKDSSDEYCSISLSF